MYQHTNTFFQLTHISFLFFVLLKSLKRQVVEQDALIAGYQRENEKLVNQFKVREV